MIHFSHEEEQSGRNVYRDDKIAVWQSAPRFVSADNSFTVTLVVRKTSGVSELNLEFTPAGDNIQSDSEDSQVFNEPERDKVFEYRINYTCKAKGDSGTKGRLFFKDGLITIGYNGSSTGVKTDFYNEISIFYQ